MTRALCLVLLGVLLAAGEASPITASTIAGTEVVTVAVPAGWTSSIILAADRGRFEERSDRVLINGGYFDAQWQPDALLINGSSQTGHLRHDSPYSGFVWSDAANVVHIARTGEAPANATWAIQSGPLLVEQGRSGINTTTSVAQRSVIALRRDQVLVIRTGRIGLKELADVLVEYGIEAAINLDGGPSSTLHVRISGRSMDRPGTVKVPYCIGFNQRAP
ncbi:MAG: phosphodiester glycosidase family protein [Planctomycetes bacterium]|nr:phosphodiester glycosidase family protein [Planctomycetota bacterium]